jgi:flagellar protein FlbD
MIILTRLNKRPVVINEDMIESIEELPDTTLMLFTGNKIIVRESAEAVLEKAAAWACMCNGGMNLRRRPKAKSSRMARR